MKTIPPPCPVPETGPKYWRSLDELADAPEFRQWVEREFPAGASEFTDETSRRHFVKIMSASFLLAGLGLTGCRRPEEKILPFTKYPEGYVHGVPQYYATAMPDRGSAVPLVAKAHEGRPIKLEGNALHPDSNGATDAFAQASILNLYDPDRAMRFTKGGHNQSRAAVDDALAQLARTAQANQGQGLCFLTEHSSSPSRARLQKLIRTQYPQAKWFTYEPVDFDIHRQAATVAFGRPVAPYPKIDQARVVVSLDCDFIGTEPDAAVHIRRFAQGRRLRQATDPIGRLYAVESLFTLTGLNADHRLRVPPSRVLQVAAQLAAAVLEKSSAAGAAGALRQSLKALGQGLPADVVKPAWIEECAKDLAAAAGKALVLAGHRQPLEVHLIAQALNAALGAVDNTVSLVPATPEPAGSIDELAGLLTQGQVDTLVVLGGNPVYNAPADLNWAQAQQKARTVVRLGYYEDESCLNGANHWHLPLAHFLESWGDARTADGTLVPIQPLIAPLFGGVTELEVLARFAGETAANSYNSYEIVRQTFRELTGKGEEEWKKFLHDGFQAGSAAQPVKADCDWAAVARAVAAVKPPAVKPGEYEVVFHRDSRLDDGRHNNNGWLQELPDPITKVVWENVILVSPRTAAELGAPLKPSDTASIPLPVVKVTVGGRSLDGPLFVQPGMADHTIGLALGYGRSKTGRVGRNTGYNAYSLRTAGARNAAAGAQVQVVAGKTHPVSSTQNHWAMEGRPIIREATLEQYRKQPGFAAAMNMHEPPVAKPLYQNPLDPLKQSALHQWGMSIDLHACVGCSACVVACQSENNIPIVGKNQVGRSREMHWMRIDRYYAGDLEEPQAVVQPMLCQHCEAAPCESVCPVNATVHDHEGLNVMAYNRCVGTRYCSNNCPYKVRRFNYLDFNRRPLEELNGPVYSTPMVGTTRGEWTLKRWFKDPDKGLRPELEWDLLKLAKNPDVTVRMRGVMEKCTFCVQRIEQAKIAQKVKAGASGDVRVPDGTIKTACQQACPAEAIVFGDISDPHSQVAQLKALDRDYTVLEFLAVKPRATYLARVRNPNPSAALPGRYEEPQTLREWKSKGNSLEGHESGHGEPGGAPGPKHEPSTHGA